MGRVLGLPYGHVDKISKMIPFDPSRPLSYKNQLIENQGLKKKLKIIKKLKN